MKPIHPAALLFLAVLFAASSCPAFAEFADKVPSCNDQVAKSRTEPGTADLCTPAIFDRDAALQFMESGIAVKKIKGKWYLFLSENEFANDLAPEKRWQAISLMISAVQSLFGRAESCYLARLPRTEEEKEALLAGSYPRDLIAASGEAVPFGDKPEEEYDWPEYHHHLLYKLTVY